jgi:hypothetical protein
MGSSQCTNRIAEVLNRKKSIKMIKMKTTKNKTKDKMRTKVIHLE